MTTDALSAASAPALDERSRELRRLAIKAVVGGQRGHIGSAMSLIEILRVLFDDVLRYRASEPQWENRDRLILSKGHGCVALYALLADKGFFPLEDLADFCHQQSFLGGHPERGKVPGVEASTGALGHGLSIALGIALGLRIKGSTSRVVAIVGDGEINEGSIWEAAMAAGKHRVSSLTAIVDYNRIQSYGFTDEVQPLEPLADKWRAFGFETREVNGHDVEVLRATFADLPFASDRPSTVICHTVKGKGIPFVENDPKWHHTSRIDEDLAAKLNAALEG